MNVQFESVHDFWRLSQKLNLRKHQTISQTPCIIHIDSSELGDTSVLKEYGGVIVEQKKAEAAD